MRHYFERFQILIYFASICVAGVFAVWVPSAVRLASAISPALAVMLFVTFLQVPITRIRRALPDRRFLGALLIANFVAIPLLVSVLIPLVGENTLLRLGVLMVLLTPCIDYVVTFSHIGRADARLLLMSTPVLLVVQMLLLPVYLSVLSEVDVGELIRPGPFVSAFVWLIAVPLGLAALVQGAAVRCTSVQRCSAFLGALPVPATAAVLFIVVASMLPRLGDGMAVALQAVPLYVVFAAVAPGVGWLVARLFRLEAGEERAVAFSAATRNSLVILPLAMAVPGAIPILPAVIVAQTMVELLASLVYMQAIPGIGAGR